MKKYLWSSTLVFLAFLGSGCTPFSWMNRVQQPLIRTATGGSMKVALIAVEVPEGVQRRAPSDFGNMGMFLGRAVTRAFQGTSFQVVDRLGAGVRMRFVPQLTRQVMFLGKLRTVKVDRGQRLWTSNPPSSLPAAVGEPLLMAIRVHQWTAQRESVSSRSGSTSQLVARVDLSYGLWNRSGKSFARRRIKVALYTGKTLAHGVTFLPKYAIYTGWNVSKKHSHWAPKGLGPLFQAAIQTNADAFAWPFGKREIRSSAVWDNSKPYLKPVIQTLGKKQWEKAYTMLKELHKKHPKSDAVLYNLAVLSEFLGKERVALGYFEKARAIKKRGGYYGQLYTMIQQRLKTHVVVKK